MERNYYFNYGDCHIIILSREEILSHLKTIGRFTASLSETDGYCIVIINRIIRKKLTENMLNRFLFGCQAQIIPLSKIILYLLTDELTSEILKRIGVRK